MAKRQEVKRVSATLSTGTKVTASQEVIDKLAKGSSTTSSKTTSK